MPSRYDRYNLKSLLEGLLRRYSAISEVYIFGSRRFQTRSTRSDVDLLLVVDGHVALEDIRDYTIETCRALDFFIADGGTATSCANGSKVRASGRKTLVRTLNAIRLWDRQSGFSADFEDWEFDVIKGHNPVLTSMVSGVPFPSKAEAISSLVPKSQLPPAVPQTQHTLIAYWTAATWAERFGMLLVYGAIFTCGIWAGKGSFISKLFDLIKEVLK